MTLLGTFLHTLETTLPVFAMVFIGLGLRRLGWIDTNFINTASALVFRATLPTLVSSVLYAQTLILPSTLHCWDSS